MRLHGWQGFDKDMRISQFARLPAALALLAAFASMGAAAATTACKQCAEWNVSQEPDFVLIDVRSPEAYSKGHVPGAINIPHGKIIESRLAQYGPDTVFVVYCAGPHCNGGHKGAIRLARLGRPVKLMIGGITGWLDEGFDLAKS